MSFSRFVTLSCACLVFLKCTHARDADASGPLGAAAADCAPGASKKACANCSCGRAEAEAAGVKAALTPDMLENPQSACGSVRARLQPRARCEDSGAARFACSGGCGGHGSSSVAGPTTGSAGSAAERAVCLKRLFWERICRESGLHTLHFQLVAG